MHSTEKTNRILLIVDDDEIMLHLLEQQLRSRQYNILTASSGESGLQIIKAKRVSVIITDQAMPGMDGITFLTEVRKIDDDAVLMMLTGNGDYGLVTKAINELKIFSYVTKPWHLPVLKSAVTDAFLHYENTVTYKITLKRTCQLNANLNKNIEKLERRVEELKKELKNVGDGTRSL